MASASACNIVSISTGAARLIAAVLRKLPDKLNGIAQRMPTPNVSIVDLDVKVSRKCSTENVRAAAKAAADGPKKGIITSRKQPLFSSDFMQNDYSNSVCAILTDVAPARQKDSASPAKRQRQPGKHKRKQASASPAQR